MEPGILFEENLSFCFTPQLLRLYIEKPVSRDGYLYSGAMKKNGLNP